MQAFFKDIWENLQGYYSEIVNLLPKLVLGILIFIIVYFIAGRISKYLNRRLNQQMDDPLLARFLCRVVKLVGVIVALLLFLKIVGLSDIALGLLTGASVSAIVIGFAFKDIGENFLAGIMLAFSRPFRVGDTVELDGITGKVISLDMRSTQIKSFDGKDIYIPNASVFKNKVINYTIDGFMRHEFPIGLDYGSDVDKAISTIYGVLEDISGIIKEPKGPDVSISSLGASTLNLSVKYWTDTFDIKYPANKIKTEVINKTLIALEKEGYYLPGDIIELKSYGNSGPEPAVEISLSNKKGKSA